MHFVYVLESANPQFTGQLLELYKEVAGEAGDREWWDKHRWQTMPFEFTEFLLPDNAGIEDLYLDTLAFTAPQAIPEKARVQFWFDPATSRSKYKSPPWQRVYGENSFGPGDPTVPDPLNSSYPVEVPPYTDPLAPFDPQAQEAPPKDSLTFNPAFLSEFQSRGEALQKVLYPRIAIAGRDALEKVWLRLWYEPEYLDKILKAGDAGDERYIFPAVMQEFTYMFLNTKDLPTVAVPGSSTFAFPVGTTQKGLWAPSGYGLTTFDADFDNVNDDVVRVHSEQTLNALTNIGADFDGDGTLSPVAGPNTPAGAGFVVFTVDDIPLSLDKPYAMFLDHMVQLLDVSSYGAQLQIWDTGGGLERLPGGGYNIIPHKVGAPMPYAAGNMGITGRNKVNVKVLTYGGDNLGALDGPWFVYVNDINFAHKTVNVTIGRALGAARSAIDDGAGAHDLTPGDPWYLKRFFVDGHEYNVVFLHAPRLPNREFGFKYITIRTPVPKVNFVNAEDSQKLQGYPVGNWISVMPPFNFEHTVAVDILPDWSQDEDNIGRLVRRPAMTIGIAEEAREPEFTGELKEVCKSIGDVERPPDVCTWINHPFTTRPDRFTALTLSQGELYLLTSSWLDEEGNRVKFWYKPGASLDLFVNSVGP